MKNTVDGFSAALRFLKKAYTMDGGKGSGNFNHAGRPGEVGGSAPGEGSGESANEVKLRDLTDKCMSKAKAAESKTTENLVSFAKDLGGEMMGLDRRFKSSESLMRKLENKSKEKGMTPEEYSKRITDVLRYTASFDDDIFTNGAQNYLSKLQKAGYTIVEVENRLRLKDVTYRGINTLIKTPSGYTFELQFHAPQSFATKEAIHGAYEILRDPHANPKLKDLARLYCIDQSNKVKTPKGVEKIADVEKGDYDNG